MEIIERMPRWLADRFADRRAEARRPVLLTAELRVGGEGVKGILLNLSSSGAMMAATEPVASGTCAELHFESHDIPVAVTWAEGRRFGLMFGHSLPSAVVDEIAASSANAGRAR